MKDTFGKPLWEVTGAASAEDFNPYLSRMTTIVITDEVGDDSDKFAITLEDDDPEHTLPAKDEEVAVKIGWFKNSMIEKGYYKYDSANLSGGTSNRSLTLNFTAADMKGTLKARRSASYINKSIPEIAEEIAKRNNLKSKVVGDVPKDKIEQIHQTAESDMSFLLRITGERNLFAKPSFGQIVIGKPGTGETSNVHDIDISEVSEWEADLQARSVTTKVKARVEVIGEGGVKYVEEGESDATGKGGGKDVTRELLQSYRDEQAAKTGAKASLESLNKEAGTIKITMPGDPKFFAEDYINIKGFSVKVDGKWRLTSVVDTISTDSWQTVLEGEREEDVMGSDKPEVVRFPVGDGGTGGVTPGGTVKPQG